MSTSTFIFIFLFTLALTGMAFYFLSQAKQHLGWWDTIKTIDAEEAHSCPDNVAVAVSGQVGAETPLNEPIKHEAAVWWRHIAEEKWREHNHDNNDSSSAYVNKSRTISDEQTQNSFLLRSATSGAVIQVNPFHYGIQADRKAIQSHTQTEYMSQMENLSVSIDNSYDEQHKVVHTVEFLKLGSSVTISGYTQSGQIVGTEDEAVKVIKGSVEEKVASIKKKTSLLQMSLIGAGILNVASLIAVIVSFVA